VDSDGHWRTHKHKHYKEGSKMTTILSVDDDPTNQVVVQKLLAAHFNVIQAMSGEEALNIISNSAKPPDFVLLDVMMPKMSGLEVYLAF
jgi:CheY-like chemotaxis protein